MREMKYLKVSAGIARRAGGIEFRYRTADGEFIINESDLRMIRFEPEELIAGIAFKVLTEKEAARLIEENGSKIGEEVINGENNQMVQENDSTVTQNNENQSTETSGVESTIDNNNTEEGSYD